MPNSSFEEGAAGWSLWHADPAISRGGVSTDGPHSGAKCFKVENPGEKGANLHSDPVPCVPDADYTLSVHVRTEGGQRIRVGAWGLDAAGKTISHMLGGEQFVPPDQPTYARIRKSFHTPENCTQIKAHLVCNGGTVWWDAVQLEQARRETPYADGPPFSPEARANLPRNMLANSGFEAGEIGWRLWHQHPAVSSGGVAEGTRQEGDYAYHVLNPGKGGANLFSDSVPCEPETTYTLSAWARVRNGSGVRIGGWGLDGQGKVLNYAIDGYVDLPRNVPEYQRFEKTFTTPEGCTLLRAHLVCGGGEVWWDAVQLEKGAEATDYLQGLTPDYDPHEGEEEGLAYTRAMIREARLRDALSQARRLCRYKAKHPNAAAAQDALAKADGLVAALTSAIGAPYMVPDFRHLEYETIDAQATAAEQSLTDVWEAFQVEPRISFEPWAPSNDGLEKAENLTNEIVIFPCFTSNRFFQEGADWEVLRPFGFRLVSGWWGARAGPNGQPEFGHLDRILEIISRHGYKADIATSAVAGVRWLDRVLPEGEIYLKPAEGRWSPRGNCHSTINIWHPRVQEESAKFLTAFGERYRNDPRVTCYELVNEPSLSIEESVHGYYYKRTGVGGYSPQARAAWIRWLAEKYGTAGPLNRRWRTNYASFARIAPPADLTPPDPASSEEPVAIGAIHDFESFRAESHARHFGRLVATLKTGDPGKPVMSQFIAAFGIRKAEACNLLSLSALPDWDYLGTHDWPGAGPAVRSLVAYSIRRYNWRPHWEDEFIWSQWERKSTPEPEMRAALTRNLWRQIAWGKRGISLFNLETEWLHDSPRTWNNSMMNIEADYKVPRYSTGAIPVVERKANLLKDTLLETRLTNQGVGILLPTTSVLAMAPELRAQRLMQGVAAWMLLRHWTPFIVPEECVVDGREDLSAFDVIIAPWAIAVPDALQEKLLAWMAGGGTLVSLGPFGLFDQYGNPTQTLLRQTLGETRWVYDSEKGSWSSPLTQQEAGEMISKAHGKGMVCLLPRPAEKDQVVAQLEASVERLLPPQPVRAELENVELLLSEDPAGNRYLFAINLHRAEARAGVVELGGEYETIRELTIEGAPTVPAACGEGITTLDVMLEPGEGLLFALG